MVQWFCLISRRPFNGQMSQLVPCDANIYLVKCMWVSDLHFMVQWFCLILKTIWWANVKYGILVSCNARNDLVKCMWVSDPYFMVQWFCLKSRRLVFGWMLHCRYWFIIYLFLPTWVCWGLENVCECSKVRNWPVDYSRQGHLCTLNTFLAFSGRP